MCVCVMQRVIAYSPFSDIQKTTYNAHERKSLRDEKKEGKWKSQSPCSRTIKLLFMNLFILSILFWYLQLWEHKVGRFLWNFCSLIIASKYEILDSINRSAFNCSHKSTSHKINWICFKDHKSTCRVLA